MVYNEHIADQSNRSELWTVFVSEDLDNTFNIINSDGKFVALTNDYDYAIMISYVPELVKIACRVIGTCPCCTDNPMVRNHSDWCDDARRIVKIINELSVNENQ